MSFDYVRHFGICVQDLEPTAMMLGLAELELHTVYLDCGGFRIELLHYSKPGFVGSPEPRPMNQLGLTHIALRVKDLNEAILSVEAHGGRVLPETRVQNESFGAHLVFATDPDGTRLELVETPQDPTR